MNPMEPGAAFSVELLVAALTTKVTWTVCGLPVAPGEATVTVPVYEPAVKPAGFTETFTVPGVVPLVGIADNQVPVAVAVKLNAAGVELTRIGLDAGVELPI